ncbi:MAG TPA: glucose dehydrogenase, partial [Alphaproteobacteria bacterium]|nr:glucose dehydrogenase [Alphaproteobacteria bacterium]
MKLKTWHVIGAAFAICMAAPAVAAPACAPDNAGLKLPDGFCATVFADKLGEARHMTVAADGTVYLNSWISPFKSTAPRIPGGFLIALKDTNGDGVADSIHRFGEDSTVKDNVGGTGIALYSGSLYAEASGKIVRYKLGGALPKDGETILGGLPMTGSHTMHSIAFDKAGALFVNSGTATNACQVKDRNLHSPGIDPCNEL